MDELSVKKLVRDGYGKIARGGGPCCLPMASCCGGSATIEDMAKRIGYTEEELSNVPPGANLGLGCGNPVALSSLREGEIVLDLGSGAGFDCFLAARQVGPNGKVIGVDMTPEMIEKARENAKTTGYENVEFRLGEIENIPLPDDSVDVVVSNCVINLSPDKRRVFREAYRVLRPGGRLMVSDIVLKKDLPDGIRNSAEAFLGCVAGAVLREQYLEAIEAAGLKEVTVLEETSFPVEFWTHDPAQEDVTQGARISEMDREVLKDAIVSISVGAVKP